MIDDVALLEVDVETCSTLPGVNIFAYVGTKRVRIWLSPDTAAEVAELVPDEDFEWPWEY